MMATYKEYRSATISLILAINQQIPIEEKDMVLMLYHLNSIPRMKAFNEWVKGKLAGETLNASNHDVVQAAVYISRQFPS